LKDDGIRDLRGEILEAPIFTHTLIWRRWTRAETANIVVPLYERSRGNQADSAEKQGADCREMHEELASRLKESGCWILVQEERKKGQSPGLRKKTLPSLFSFSMNLRYLSKKND
jgi:hypothetical protein